MSKETANGRSTSFRRNLSDAFNAAVMGTLIGGFAIGGGSILTFITVAGFLAGAGVAAATASTLGIFSGAIVAGALTAKVRGLGDMIKPKTFWASAGLAAAGLTLCFLSAASKPQQSAQQTNNDQIGTTQNFHDTTNLPASVTKSGDRYKMTSPV